MLEAACKQHTHTHNTTHHNTPFKSFHAVKEFKEFQGVQGVKESRLRQSQQHAKMLCRTKTNPFNIISCIDLNKIMEAQETAKKNINNTPPYNTIHSSHPSIQVGKHKTGCAQPKGKNRSHLAADLFTCHVSSLLYNLQKAITKRYHSMSFESSNIKQNQTYFTFLRGYMNAI